MIVVNSSSLQRRYIYAKIFFYIFRMDLPYVNISVSILKINMPAILARNISNIEPSTIGPNRPIVIMIRRAVTTIAM